MAATKQQMNFFYANNTKTPNCNMADNNNNCMLDEKLPIFVNGHEKYATGLTKRTTVDDVKFAMLTVSDPTFKAELLDEYVMLERWQGNERILEGKIKIYKLIRLWQSLPGNQLAQVKFMIKKIKSNNNSKPLIYHDNQEHHNHHHHRSTKQQQQQQPQMKLSCRDANKQVEQPKSASKKQVAPSPSASVALNGDPSKKYTFCTISPALQKTWAIEKARRKSSYVKRQLRMTSQTRAPNSADSLSDVRSSSTSVSPASSDVDDESSDELNENRVFGSHKRYASIKRFNRARKSTIKRTQQMKKSFIELVNKQNEIIDKQLNKLSDIESLSAAAKRSKSVDVEQSNGDIEQQQVNENDVRMTFGTGDEKQVREYTRLCNDYFKLQSCLNGKLKKIDDLSAELSEIKQMRCESKLAASIQKTSKKLQSSIDTNKAQAEKISDLSEALTNIDDIIALKTKFIESLEQELERLELNEQQQQQQPVKKSLAYTSASSTSSTSSTSSVLTSISSVSTSTRAKPSPPTNYMSVYNDNESDTGISSANSDDFSTQLETLV